MLQGRVGDGKSGLGVEHPWDVSEFTSLEARVLVEQVTYGLEII